MEQTYIIPDVEPRSEPLLPADEVERRFGLPPRFLERRRDLPGGPKFFKLGERTVRYRASDVAGWLEDCACAGVPRDKARASR